jgi:hypothetical protein
MMSVMTIYRQPAQISKLVLLYGICHCILSGNPLSALRSLEGSPCLTTATFDIHTIRN